MTTPWQPAPDGAYVIGGTSTGDKPVSNYGQNLNDQAAVQVMLGSLLGVLNPFQMLDMIGDILRKLPLEVLQMFEGMIPDVLEGAFDFVESAIEAILGHFGNLGPLLNTVWNEWILGTFNIIATELQQIFEVVGGLIVTPISDFVQGFKDWFDLLTGQTSGLDAFGNLGALGDLITDLLSNPADVLGSLPQTLVSGLTSALSGLDNAVDAAGEVIQDIIDAIISALRKVPFVGGTIANLFDNLTNYTESTETDIVNQQNFTISNVTSQSRNPAWVCRYPAADVSYPEFFNGRLSVFGDTETASTGTAHTHELIDQEAIVPGQGVLQDRSRGGYVTVSTTTVFDTVAMGIYRSVGTALNNVFLEVFKELEDGGLERIFSEEISSSISVGNTATTYIERDIPALIAQAGDRFLVRVRNYSSVSTALWVKGITQENWGIDASFATANTTESGQTSISAADAVAYRAATRILPWAMLASKGLAATDQSFSDDFNRTALGGLWVPVSNTGSNQLGITSNRAAFKGATDGDQLALYATRVSGDQQQVEATLHNTIVTPRMGVMSCCNAEMTQTVYLGVNNLTAKLYTGAWNSLTERKSVVSTGNNVKWGVYNDPNTATFYIIKDGTDVDSWVDSGGVVQYGRDYRYGGVRVSRASASNAGQLDDWTFRDFAR